MAKRSKISTIHLAGTIWFIFCVGYILTIALLQAGVKWWVLFSLSVHSVLLALLLISWYLFAIFRGISSSQKLHAEHPITRTDQYSLFYAATPFLGGIGGLLGMMGENSIHQYLSGITLGTLGTTFVIWIIVDPVLGLLEMFLPKSRKYYLKRQAETKILREEKQKERDRLLAEVTAKFNSEHKQWHEQLKPQAEKLAQLLSANISDFRQAEYEAADIGTTAWQIGGMPCMRELHNMAIEMYKQKNQEEEMVDYISSWWDGIGSWKDTSLC